MIYFSFLEDKNSSVLNSRELLKQHYINCCDLVGEKLDQGYEKYFNSMDDETVKKMIDYLNIK